MPAQTSGDTLSEGPADLIELLSLRQLDSDLFVNNHSVRGSQGGGYGGQTVAQALLAAAGTVGEGRVAHSLHASFLRPARVDEPTRYQVERDRDGRSYSARRVLASQGDSLIFTMTASFQVREDGPDVQAVSAPNVAGPAQSTPIDTHLFGVEVRDPARVAARPHPHRFWTRCLSSTGDDGNLNAAAVAYASDLFSGLPSLVDVGDGDIVTSLDHALWFHRPVQADQWVLMDFIGTSLAANRGFYNGQLYDESGTAVAGLSQEMVLRLAPRD